MNAVIVDWVDWKQERRALWRCSEIPQRRWLM